MSNDVLVQEVGMTGEKTATGYRWMFNGPITILKDDEVEYEHDYLTLTGVARVRRKKCDAVGPSGWKCELAAGHEGMHCGSVVVDQSFLKCDGNHGGPPCEDPHCWNRCSSCLEAWNPEHRCSSAVPDSFDARDWAREFRNSILSKWAASNGDVLIDDDTLIGWFANALMRGYDEGQCRKSEPITEENIHIIRGEPRK